MLFCAFLRLFLSLFGHNMSVFCNVMSVSCRPGSTFFHFMFLPFSVIFKANKESTCVYGSGKYQTFYRG